jgi:hypothetical protein
VAEAEGGDDGDHGDGGGEVRACVALGGSGSVGWSASAGRQGTSSDSLKGLRRDTRSRMVPEILGGERRLRFGSS